MLVVSVFGSVGYTFNVIFLKVEFSYVDFGGSVLVHVYGAYYGIVISRWLAKKEIPLKTIEKTKISILFSILGFLFMFLMWPTFNASNPVFYSFDKVDLVQPNSINFIVINTMFSMIGSFIGSIIMNVFLNQKIDPISVILPSLSGGVVMGAPAVFIQNPGVSCGIGFIVGILSTLCFLKLTKKCF